MTTSCEVNDGREAIDDSEADDDSPAVLVSVDSVGVLSIDDTSDADVMTWSMSRNNISPCLQQAFHTYQLINVFIFIHQ